MKLNDAAKILGLNGTITPDITKRAFHEAALKFHPDVNPAGEEMMKLVIDAYQTLKDYSGSIDQTDQAFTYPDALNDALNTIIGIDGLSIEICGAWLWVTGDTYSYRDVLKNAKFRWAKKKQAWYFRPDDWKSASRGKLSLDEIRAKFGSETFTDRRQKIEDEAA